MMNKLLKACLVVVCCITGCREAKNPEPDKLSGIKKYEINARETGANIDQDDNKPHIVHYPADSNRTNRLYLFLPGTFAAPETYNYIILEAARRGYYSIGLKYPNDISFTGACQGETSDCGANMAEEILTGNQVSDKVTVNRNNSIEKRLISLLKYLNRTYPDEDWSRFMDNGKIAWSNISVAGHSQGSGHAAYIGWKNQCLKVNMFSGPNGFAVSGLENNRMTPSDRYFGFVNDKDNFEQITAAWKALKLPGPVVNVDSADHPYQNSHQLITRVDIPPTQGSLLPNHGSTCVDAVTPLNQNEQPEFAGVWAYMGFPSKI